MKTGRRPYVLGTNKACHSEPVVHYSDRTRPGGYRENGKVTQAGYAGESHWVLCSRDSQGFSTSNSDQNRGLGQCF